MYLELTKSGILNKVTSVRKNGKVGKIRIKLGYIENLKKELGVDDPLKYYQEEIDKLKLEKEKKSITEQKIIKLTPKIPFQNLFENDDVNFYNSLDKNLGSIILSKIYHKLFLDDVCSYIKRKEKIKTPLNKVLQLEIFSRVIDPSSKYNDFKNKDNFAEIFNISKDNIYDSLDILYKYKNSFIKSIRDNIKSIVKLDKSRLHTDGSNIYVYTKGYDEIITEEENENDGEVIEKKEKIQRELLQYGYSKENKSLPIAQFMYITDANGLPLNFKAYQGSKPDISLYNDFINETKNIYDIEKSIIVADAGFVSNDNIVNSLESNMHYIFKESVLRLNKAVYDSFKTNILSMVEELEKESPDFKGFYKSFNVEVPRKYIDKYGLAKTRNITQKYIFVYSKKQDERLTNLRIDELKKVDELINDKKKLEQILKRISSSLTKVDNKEKIDISVDKNKLEKYEDTSGFSLLITDMLDMDELEIIKAYRNQYLVEDVFKNLKSSFNIRPVFLKKEERIKSHMLICFFALVFSKIIYLKLEKKHSITKIQKAIKLLRLSKISDNNIWELKGESLLIKNIFEKFSINLKQNIFDGNDIRNIVKICKEKV